jgi:hypothetical protein
MTIVGPPAVVDAPLLAPPPSGLLYVSRVLRDNAVSPHEEMGTKLLPEGCGQWTVHDPCGFTSAAAGSAPTIVYAPPFIIDAEDVCTSSSNDITEGRARRLLETVTHAVVERELWDGPVTGTHTGDGARFFGDSTAVVLAGTLAAPSVVSPRLGLALLEEFLGGTGSTGLGVIHATRATASLLVPPLPGQTNPVLRTPLGTLFAAGSGYSGKGPNGVAPGATERWMFASDPVEVRLHAPVITDRASSLDRSVNNVRTHARRTASISSSWCRLGAVLVDLTAA